MLNEKLEQAFNDQINAEFYSEYLYLSMAAYFERINLQGFKNWMNVQIQEEHAHAMGLFNYVHERNAKVTLQQIAQPKNDWESTLELFEDVYKHEQYITSKINELISIAEEVNDRAAVIFLDWYVKEQVEEESNVSNILKTLKLICNDNNCLYMFDKELASRVYTAPEIN
ncbi:MAG: ferritin [Candidatus Gastranaerophilales bacterium]|nr:ferritin [Candidatus Gastranaerophilales bacterium]